MNQFRFLSSCVGKQSILCNTDVLLFLPTLLPDDRYRESTGAQPTGVPLGVHLPEASPESMALGPAYCSASGHIPGVGRQCHQGSSAVCSWIEETVPRGGRPSFPAGGRAGVSLGRTFPQGPLLWPEWEAGSSAGVRALGSSSSLSPGSPRVPQITSYLSVCLSI